MVTTHQQAIELENAADSRETEVGLLSANAPWPTALAVICSQHEAPLRDRPERSLAAPWPFLAQ